MAIPPPKSLYSWRTIHPATTLHYIRDPDQANTQLSLLEGPVLGFDLEWKPTFTKNTPEHPVSVVQLANKDTILLIQISAMQEFPSGLQELLDSPDFVKAGVGIQNDVQKLYRDCQVSTRNCVDLSLLARSVDNQRWKGKYSNPIGLARLVETYQDLVLPKGKITRSNWDSVLSEKQQEYASNDAHAGLVIYEKLMDMLQSMEAPPKSVYYTFDSIRGRLCEPSGAHWSAHNPNYDPGPPPPPKVPKPPKAKDVVTSHSKATSVAQPSSSSGRTNALPSTSAQSPHNSGTHKTQRPFLPRAKPTGKSVPNSSTGYPSRRPYDDWRSRHPSQPDRSSRPNLGCQSTSGGALQPQTSEVSDSHPSAKT